MQEVVMQAPHLIRFVAFVLLVEGYVWTSAGVSKITSGVFPATLGKTLTFFASKNPYEWYGNFLLAEVVPRATLLGYLIEWGELLAGLVFLAAGGYMLYKKALLAVLGWGVVGVALLTFGLNVQFYLAAGWTSVASAQLNLLMLGVELAIIGLFIEIWRKGRVYEGTSVPR